MRRANGISGCVFEQSAADGSEDVVAGAIGPGDGEAIRAPVQHMVVVDGKTVPLSVAGN